MSKDLKQETLLESQAELEQENEETEEGVSLFCGSCDIAGKDI